MRDLSLLLAATFLALACRAADLPVVAVTIADHGKTIELKPGQPFQVVLDSNRTTGYSWSLDKINADLLTLVGQPVYTPTEAKPGLVGSGGREMWHFIAVAPGEQPMQFVYRRPFEPNVPPARTFTFTVRIKS